jgi:beta-glucosidase
MTLEEKALILTGNGWWQTHKIDRLGIPSVYMCDGPHGLRKVYEPGLAQSDAATCFPTGAALACSWDVELLREVGAALGKECQAADVQILLGPGINMKRSPLGGRNFEYYSEDPFLAGKLAAAYIKGVQSEGVSVCLKHFAVNNQETERMVTSSDLDERTLHEIYLTAFEIAIREAEPWTIMTAYNPVNGVDSTENSHLLRTVLRDQWGFKGFVIADWGAVNDRIVSLIAGTNLEMPGSGSYNPEKIIAAVREGRLQPERLDQLVTQLLSIVLKIKALHRHGTTFDIDAHHALARRVSAESIVLLKNEDGILPLASTAPSDKNAMVSLKKTKVAIIGAFAKNPRYQGAGSSLVRPSRTTNAYDEFQKFADSYRSVELFFAEGCQQNGTTDDQMVDEAKKIAREADIALVFVGLPDDYESEAFDRRSMFMPYGHDRLMSAVSEVQPNCVAVIMTGSAVEMPWQRKVKSIVHAGLGGQAGGGAIVDVLTGEVNPSGKLAETFPQRLQDLPTYPNFPGSNGHAYYGEGVFIGYRYYEKKSIDPLFPFGHGLSYTRFSYSEMKTSTNELVLDGILMVELTVKNAGKIYGKEVVQLYVRELKPNVVRPEKELKAFAKIALQPGEHKSVRFELDRRAFAVYDPPSKSWFVNSGQFELLAGSSSQNIQCRSTITVKAVSSPHTILTRESLIKHFENHPRGRQFYPRLVNATNLGLFKDAELDLSDWTERKRSNLSTWAYVDNLPVKKLPALSEGKFTEQMLYEILSDVVQEK